MSLNDSERQILVNLYLERAQRTFEEMEVAIAAQKWGMAANRIYYAVFHAVTAMFIYDGHPVGTHRGAKAILGQHYVLSGKISTASAKLFAQLETLREKADYNIMFVAQDKDVMPHVDRARNFIEEIKRIVGVA